MARPNLSQAFLALPDSAKLDRHLQEAFNTPTPQWWESAQYAFLQLQTLSGSNPRAVLDPQLDDPVDEYAVNARLSRAASLPSISLLPSGNHALGLTATNESLQCVAFGTVGRKRFVELLWESIAQAQDAGVAKIAVHEILQGEIPQITLRVEAHIFELQYIQCEPLVRAYPSIIDAPSAFIQDRNSCSTTVQKEVQKLQQPSKLQVRFKDCPGYRRAYYYKRAWAIAWGLFNRDQEAREVFELCDQASLESGKDFSSIVSHFLEQWSHHYPQTLEYQSSDCDQLLSLIEVEPLHKKLNYPHYLQVTVLYTGSSSLKGGEWLSMVERKLEWLKINLNALVTPTLNLIPEPAQRVSLWPQRLVRSHAGSEDGVYEGCFVLGLDIQESALSSAMQVAERWKLGIDHDDLTIKDQCFLDVIFQGKAEIEKQDLKPCTRIWPRPIVKSEVGSNESQSLRFSKREKRELKDQKDQLVIDTPVEIPKTNRKLRPASDVLSRLRYGRDYDIDEFVVGYKDRHSLRLMEKPAAQWAKDTTDEEFIPEHRIEYFKRYDCKGEEEVFWDKSLRMDKIFQHGGSV